MINSSINGGLFQLTTFDYQIHGQSFAAHGDVPFITKKRIKLD
jgi:hypothetical protein